MKSLMRCATEFFEREGWAIQGVPDSFDLALPFNAVNGQWTCIARGYEEDRTFVFYSLCPFKSTPSRHAAVAELICRLNYSALSGSFELGFLDGEVRLRTSIEVPETELTPDLIDRIVYNNVATMNLYLPAFRAVIEDGVSPLVALSDALLVQN